MVPAMESKVDYVLGERVPEPATPIEIAPGILWIRLPMPIALDHINLYLLDDGDAWVLIDTGMADPISIGTWEVLLETKLSGRPIRRVIGTHFHPDHVGLAGWLLAKTGADFWMTQLEWLSARQAYLDVEDASSEQMRRFYHRVGLGKTETDAYREMGNDYRSMVSPIPSTYSRIGPETTFTIGGRLWTPIFGSGHSPDHVSFYCAEDRIMLGGDMLLPRITPIIAVWWQEPDGDPLAGYLEFLGTLGHIADDVLVLPAHNRPYRELRTRVTDLRDHHVERLEITFDACATPATGQDVMKALFTREMDSFQTRFAIGETVAHINNLVNKGELLRNLDEDDRYRYERVA
jgi:glyoxylase-like metal-dependent hydrolase (beta-lactamase superfamily II)